MGKIDFFKMLGCFYCDEAEKMLAEQISGGLILKKSAEQCQQAGHSPRGFPFFHCSETGKSKTGLPKSFEDLCRELGISPHDSSTNHSSHHSPTPSSGSDNVCKVWVMKGCHWCKRLVEEIEPLIKANKCKVIQHDDTSEPAPASAKGFPYSTNKGKKVSGYMPKNEFVKALEIDMNETTQENFKMAQLQQTLYQNELAKQQMQAHFRENFEQMASVPPSATTEKAVTAAQDKRNQSATTACSKYNNTDMRSCEGSSGQQTCHWNEATNKCGLFNPHSASQVIDPRNCRPGNCPPLKAEPPQQFRRIMLEGGEVAWVDEFDLVGPDAFTMLAFSGCESDGNESGGCKSGYSMFGVL